MELKDYTTEELRAEIKRRNELAKEAKMQEPRYRNCKYLINHPIGILDEDYAWAVYAFINDWKSGKYGEVELQKAIKDNFKY